MSTKSNRINPSDIAGLTLPHTGTRVAVRILGAVLFTGLTIVGANITIPLYPVPITLQTLFVALSGAVLGPAFGMLSQSLYILLGAVGIPVFADGASGLQVLTGHSAGYLLGFMLAPLVVGRLINRRGEAWWQLLTFYLGSLTILSLGVTHLRLFFADDLGQALSWGYFPFIVGDLVKILVATSIYRSYRAIRTSRRR